MEPDTLAATFEKILAASQQSQASTTASRPSSAPRLSLRASPQREILPQVQREIHRAPAPLLATLRALLRGEARWPLLVTGPAGTGKTCACLALLDYVVGAAYQTVPGFCALLIESQQGRLEWSSGGHGGKLWPAQLWAKWRESSLACLDEIGARATVTDHHYETVKACLDERQGRPLIAASNLDLATIGKLYDDRIASRLAAGTVLQLEGEDRRIARKP